MGRENRLNQAYVDKTVDKIGWIGLVKIRERIIKIESINRVDYFRVEEVETKFLI